MPEMKNNFLKGRMNKDLDERLLQNGEYRDARNLSISSSDTGNSGSAETVIGNVEATSFGLTDRNLEIIGKFEDVENNRIFVFLTNYTDSSPSTVDNFAASASSHYIAYYDIRREEYAILVKGRFLNFSKTHRILHVDLLEDLLFWTDDRNQPRKINVETAISNSTQIDSNPYYSKEEHISVAKYYPYNAIRLYEYSSVGKLNTYNHPLFDNITQIFDTATLGTSTTYTVNIPSGSVPESSTSGSGTGAVVELDTDAGANISDIRVTSGGSGFAVGDTITFVDPTGLTTDEMIVTIGQEDIWIDPTMKDTTSLNLPYSAEATSNAWGTSSSGDFVRSDSSQDLTVFDGCLIYVKDNTGAITVPISDGITIDTISLTAGDTFAVTLTGDPITIASTDTIYLGANPYYNEDDISTISNIRDKFVRFAYRFKYDDNEYSLISPFTQSVFVPKQGGHFTGDSTDIDKDEQSSIKSSNVDFFENSITEVGLVVDLPDGISTVAELATSLKVKEIDILYKDANEPSVKVVKTIKETEILSDNSTELKYDYKSTNPVKVLPESDIVRVFDKIPVRAKTQEVIGNRVVYGNYIESFASPDSLDFSASYGDKGYQYEYDDAFSRREYPNHTLKQNRTYQVAITFADKYGRKSTPIISDNSTVFAKYKDEQFTMIDANDVYMGDALRVLFSESVPEDTDNPLYAGLYDEDTNPMGWYSYQIVVKQKEQSYYNAYIPSILNGYPKNATDIDNDLAHITLIGDNINKIPRDFESSTDLDGVYRSKSQIYPRVTNTEYTSSHNSELFVGDSSPNKITLIGGRDELGLNKTVSGQDYLKSPFYGIPKPYVSQDTSTNPIIPEFLNLGSNPLIARVSTRESLGAEGGNAAISDDITFDNLRLNVVEVRAEESNLELYWETSTSGLVSEINTEILVPENSDGIPYQVADFNFTFAEDSETNDIISSDFIIQDFSGNDILNANTANTFISVRNKTGGVYNGFFSVEKDGGTNKFRLKFDGIRTPYYSDNSWRNEVFDIVMGFSNVVNGETVTRNIVVKDNAMINRIPTFAEDGTNIGDVPTALNLYASTNSLEFSTYWREVGDVTISNGAYWAPDTLEQLKYKIDSVEWYSTNDSAWYNYWYIDALNSTTGNIARWTRNPYGLVKLIYVENNGTLYMKLVYSPLLQWGWFDRPHYTVPSSVDIDNDYEGETPIVFSNYNKPLSYAGVIGTFWFSGSIGNPRNGLLNKKFIDNNYLIPTNGLEDDRRGLGYNAPFRNVTGESSLTSDMQVRVTFTLKDANRDGLSAQFTVLFDVEYGGYAPAL